MARKILDLVNDTLKEIFQKSNDNFEELYQVGSDHSSKISALESGKATKAEVELERQRINAIASLPEGSTTGDAEIADARVGAEGESYASLGEAIRGQREKSKDEVEQVKGDLADITTVTKNLVNAENIQIGKYYSSQYLNVVDNLGYALYPKIDLKPNTKYTIGSSVRKSFTYISRTGSSNLTFEYCLNTVFSEVVVNDNGSITFKTDSVTNAIYITTGIDYCMSIMLVEGESLPLRYVNGKSVHVNNLSNNIETHYLTVNKSFNSQNTVGFGTVNFNSIVSAIKSITDSSDLNRYTIYVYHGNYDIYDELGGDAWLDNLNAGERCGLELPDYTDLIGLNGLATLELTIPNDLATLENSTKVSTLNVWKHNKIKNLIVKATNCRYACHIETNNNFADTNIEVENCEFYHLGATKDGLWTSRQAVACGTGSGGNYKFSNCYMYSRDTQPFTIHNNLYQNTNTVIFDGCHFGRGNGNNNSDICFYTLDSTISGSEKDVAIIKNSIFNNIGGTGGNNIWQVCDYVNGTITEPNI